MWLLLKNYIPENIKINNKKTRLIKIEKTSFLVGKNNSGKSYFLRNVLNNVEKVYLTKEVLIQDLEEVLNSFSQVSYNRFKNTENDGVNKLYNKYVELQKILKELDNTKYSNNAIIHMAEGTFELYNFRDEILQKAREELLPILNIDSKREVLSVKLVNHINELEEKLFKMFIDDVKKLLGEIGDEEINSFGFLLSDVKKEYEIEKFYLPITRMIRHPLKKPDRKLDEENDKDIFSERIRLEYLLHEDINIITGLNFYKDYKQALLGSKEKREKVSKFEEFISQYFFNSRDISIIPDEKTQEIKVNINDGEDMLIYNVGDGITSLIILMYSVFMNYDNEKIKIFFIEEPENNFHPGYQKLFINMINSYRDFKNCIFVITTHSNHILDIGNEEYKSIIYLCKNNNGQIDIIEKNKDYYEILSELGVSSTSVLIANKTIWIEGKYDALYIRRLLNLKYIKDNVDRKKFIEDYDYCFIPYGGGNMILIDFNVDNENDVREFICKAKSINPQYCVVLDDDNMKAEGKKQKIKNYQTLIKGLGKDRVYKHNVREIENYFSEEIVKDFIKNNVKEDYRNDSFVEKLNIRYDEYKMQSLGKYINNQIKDHIICNDKRKTIQSITGRKSGFEKNGALYDKQKYYNTVCKFMEKDDFTYDGNVSKDIKDLINFIEKFISL